MGPIVAELEAVPTWAWGLCSLVSLVLMVAEKVPKLAVLQRAGCMARVCLIVGALFLVGWLCTAAHRGTAVAVVTITVLALAATSQKGWQWLGEMRAKWRAYRRTAALFDCSETDGCENVDYVLWSRTANDDGDSRCQSLGTFSARFREISVEVLVPNCAGNQGFWPSVWGRLNLHAPPDTEKPFVAIDVTSGGHANAWANGSAEGRREDAAPNMWHSLRIERDRGSRKWRLVVNGHTLHELDVPSAEQIAVAIDMWYKIPEIGKTATEFKDIRDGMIAQAWFRNFRVR